MNIKLPHEHTNVNLINKLNEGMPEGERFESAAELLKLVSDPVRLKIFWTLCHIEECVIDLAVLIGITPPALCHHLKILKDGGVVISRRDGKEVYYTAASSAESRLLHRTIEEIMKTACPQHKKVCCNENDDSVSEGNQTAKEVHKYLSENLDKRITIEELSRLFHINPTTLKESFKSLYGTSIAAHIKEHRIEKAEELLITTELSVGEIARTVGYASQSKFSAAFSEEFGFSPLEYRKRKKI